MRKVPKDRLTVTVDPAYVKVGMDAVARGAASSLSAWVNAALADRVEQERRLAAMDEAIAAYEARRGKITDAELEEQRRHQRKNRVVIGARSKNKRRRAA